MKNADTKAAFTAHVQECPKCSLFPLRLCPAGTKLMLPSTTTPEARTDR